MIALLARLVAIVPVLLHGVFGCCWHHAHFHAHASACATASEHSSAGECSEHEHHRTTDADDSHNHAQVRDRHAGCHATSLAMCVRDVERLGRTSLPDGASESNEDDGGEDGCNEDRCNEDGCALSLVAVPSGLRSETSSEVDFSGMLSSHDSLRIVFLASGSGSVVSSDPPFGSAFLHRAHLQVWRI